VGPGLFRDGHWIAAHWRRAPARGSSSADGDAAGDTDRANTTSDASDISDAEPVVRVNWWRRLLGRAPADGRGGGRSRRELFERDRTRRWADADGRDRAEELRRDPATQPAGTLRRDIDQWDRPGGAAQLQRDLERLGPVGEPEVLGDGRIHYRLRDGRSAILRPSSSPGEPPTLEITEPSPIPRRGIPTDKFRYRIQQ
jgi:hypothetical protein